jgi:hypothetical protein
MAEDQLVERARDLMTGAANAFATVQGVLHLSRDPEGARAAWRRRKSFATFPVHAIEVTITDEMRARLPRKFQIVIPDEADGRIWVRHPWTVRTEGAIGWDQQPWAPVHYRIIEIIYKHISWNWDLRRGRFKGPETRLAQPAGPVELLDPRRLLRYWTLTSLGHATVAGRPTIRVRAEPEPADPDQYSISMLNQFSSVGDAADTWELDVDQERGVILKLSSVVAGAPFMTVEFTSVAFDEPIPEEVFTFVDCAGDQEAPLWHQRHDDLAFRDQFLP